MPASSDNRPVESTWDGIAHFVRWWGKIVYFFLCVSIALIGIGRIQIPVLGLSFSSWSVSRTVFFSWLLWKIFSWVRGWPGESRWSWKPHIIPIPLILFVALVTASLLPNFDHLGDYRYFIFAFFHYLMVVDVFRGSQRQSLLFHLLGIAPGFLLLRGILADPTVANLSLISRFGYPLDHANTAGYLFSMGVPLSLVIALSRGHPIRWVAGVSMLCQLVALVLSFSRTSWIACATSLFSVSLLERKFRSIVLVLGIIGLVVLGVSSELRSRLWSLHDVKSDAEDSWRLEVMATAISLGLERPFLGHGYGRDHLRAALKKNFPDFANGGFVGHSHNLYTELASGIGYLGLAVFVWVLVSACVLLLRQIVKQSLNEESRYRYLGFFASLIAFIVGGLGDVPFYHHTTRIFFFTLLALIHLQLGENRHFSGETRG